FSRELALVRAELDRLENLERDLLRRLADTRAAAQVQRRRIGDLIRRGQPPIHRLPIEILLWIIDLATRGPRDSGVTHQVERKGVMASVSRHWRNTISSCPSFWTQIILTPATPAALVQAHVTRSCSCLVSIQIHGWYCKSSQFRPLSRLLDIVLTCAHRWCTFTLDPCCPLEVCEFIYERMEHCSFDCLDSVDVNIRIPDKYSDSGHQSYYPWFLESKYLPNLKQMVLHTSTDGFLLPSGLTTLSITLPDY
ncbi:hypothetical protein V8B97DRAFT_1841778, partial [Scleroderma yunnanense]